MENRELPKDNILLLSILVAFSTAVLLGVGAYIWIKSDGAKDQFSYGPDEDGRGPEGPEERDYPPELQEAIEKGNQLSNGNCYGDGPVELTDYPMNPEDFKYILPYGLMTGNHVTPIDHQYFEPADRSLPGDPYEVYAMADGKITEIQGREEEGDEEYRLVFMHTCTFFTYFDLVTKLTPEIESEYNSKKEGNYAVVDIDVTSGQQIGWIGGQTLDFAVWNTGRKLDFFVVPEHYDTEPWKIHTSNPYDYYSEEILQTMIDKNLRTDEPIQGQIDYDQDGKLVGNWFLEGTEGYGSGYDYWKTHLSISPDHIDSGAIIASFGDFEGEPQQHLVKDPTPYPTEADVNSGLVKYELYDSLYYLSNGDLWDRESRAGGVSLLPAHQMNGCVLFELIEDRRLKMETFPNQSCDEITGFTGNAKYYER